MRVLVTGADGFVGKHLCRHLREQGDDVVEAHGPPARGASSGGAPLDVTDPANVREVVETARPEVVIHLALLDAAPKGRLLLIGSAEMYGALPAGARATEDFPLRPVSPYAASKVAAEVAGLQFHRATGLDVVAVRPFNHIGAGQAPHFVVPSFARQVEAIRTRRSPRTLQVGDLTVTRDFCHVDDVVRAYRLLALHAGPGETYNVCSGEGRTIRSLLDELLEMAGVTAAVEVDHLRLRPAEIPSLVGDSAKLRKLGWQPSRTVRDALREVLEEASAAGGTGG